MHLTTFRNLLSNIWKIIIGYIPSKIGYTYILLSNKCKILLKVTIRKPIGSGDDKVQFCEIVQMNSDFDIPQRIKTMLSRLGYPYRCHIDFSILCADGKQKSINFTQNI